MSNILIRSPQERREDGAMIVGSEQIGSTLMCPHCGGHFESRPGSGAKRGFCLHCSSVTCGAQKCMACVPIEARLDHVEGRNTRYDDTIQELIAQGASLL